MRIISGRWGGRKLKSFAAAHLRPTTDRVKESIFNKLMSHWGEADVLDLFAGTGNLGLEALSRGARMVVSVESHAKSRAIIRENCKLLEAGDALKLVGEDVFKYLATASDNFAIVLADPPFTKKIAHEVMLAIAKSRVVREESWVVIESAKKERMDESYDKLIRVDCRDYGDKVVSYFRMKSHD